MSEVHYERLAAQDISFLPQESELAPMHIAWLWLFDAKPLQDESGRLQFDRIRDFLGAGVNRIPRLRQCLAFVPIENDPVWVDDADFDLSDHIRLVQLPEPGDQKALLGLVEEIHAERLDRSVALWEMRVVEGLSEDRFAIVCRMHHCMVDGGAIVYLMSRIFSDQPVASVDPVEVAAPRPGPDGRELMRDALNRRIEMPKEIAREVKALIERAREEDAAKSEVKSGLLGKLAATWSTVSSGITLAPKTILNRPIDAEREIMLVQREVDEALAIRKALGGTVNDVILAAVTGAVHRYLERASGDVPEGFRVVVPVSTRSEEDLAKLGNDASGWVLSLPADEADLGFRYEKVLEATFHHKETEQSHGATTLYQTAEWAGTNLIAFGVAFMKMLRPYNMIVSNHPRLDKDVYLLESVLLEGYPLNPLLLNQGLVISLTSYRGKLMIALIANPAVVSSLGLFEQDLNEAFDELCDLAAERSA